MSKNLASLVLAGDISGTKSNLAFVRGSLDTPETIAERSDQNRDFLGMGSAAPLLAEIGVVPIGIPYTH